MRQSTVDRISLWVTQFILAQFLVAICLPLEPAWKPMLGAFIGMCIYVSIRLGWDLAGHWTQKATDDR